jgi:hypothetical protein
VTWVGVAGFEPAASSSRTKRAAKLRYTPPARNLTGTARDFDSLAEARACSRTAAQSARPAGEAWSSAQVARLVTARHGSVLPLSSDLGGVSARIIVENLASAEDPVPQGHQKLRITRSSALSGLGPGTVCCPRESRGH